MHKGAICWHIPIRPNPTILIILNLIRDGENGFIVGLRPDEISRKIDWVVENPELIELVGSAGRASVEQFNLDAVGNQWLKVIRR